ncbi:MAG TPA: serine hydrolase [Cytophagales bacterium]|nr:serine hydrolase [Cytophagales bacterium]HAA19996.1 serine hydrolase [Cytophagales bacterium]HAP63648.1 serine hydrolase [Cytophagales bacterium]
MRKQSMILVAMLLVFTLNSCHVARFVRWNFADADDYKKFDKVQIENEGSPFVFTDATDWKQVMLPDSLKDGKKVYAFEEALERSNTVAFLVIRRDTILYESYLNGRTEESLHPSFSSVKSVVSMLVGIAVAEGSIASVDEPITNYLPELADGAGFEKITIEHLLDMRSGIRFSEAYFNPFGDAAKYYYGKDIRRFLPQLKIKQAPDEEFDYVSINTQLLALIVEEATQTPIATYLQEKVWKPLGMEFPATWSVDSDEHQVVKAFCCLNARTRDFAKLGRLYLNQGNWNGTQVVPEDWVQKSIRFDAPKNNFQYSYQWWHTPVRRLKTDSAVVPEVYYEKEYTDEVDGQEVTRTYYVFPDSEFYAVGFLGQVIYVHPEKEIIIVRLGDGSGKINWLNLFWDIVNAN